MTTANPLASIPATLALTSAAPIHLTTEALHERAQRERVWHFMRADQLGLRAEFDLGVIAVGILPWSSPDHWIEAVTIRVNPVSTDRWVFTCPVASAATLQEAVDQIQMGIDGWRGDDDAEDDRDDLTRLEDEDRAYESLEFFDVPEDLQPFQGS
jgi:hypothetical protein